MLRVPESINILGFELNYLFPKYRYNRERNQISNQFDTIQPTRAFRISSNEIISKAEETILKNNS